jgi:Uma2 family endonuclease
LIRLPPGKLKHTQIIHRLQKMLEPFVEKAGPAARLGEVWVEAGYKFGVRAYLQPDVSISYRDQPSGDYFEGAPLLAIAVISESNTAEQMDRKIKTYLSNGGVEVWVVYPKSECIWVFRESHAEEFRDTLRSEVVNRIDIGRLFD